MRRSGSPTRGIGNGCVNVHRPSVMFSIRVARPLRGGSADGNIWFGRRSLPLSSSAGADDQSQGYFALLDAWLRGEGCDGGRGGASRNMLTSRWCCCWCLDGLGAGDRRATEGRRPWPDSEPCSSRIIATCVTALHGSINAWRHHCSTCACTTIAALQCSRIEESRLHVCIGITVASRIRACTARRSHRPGTVSQEVCWHVHNAGNLVAAQCCVMHLMLQDVRGKLQPTVR